MEENEDYAEKAKNIFNLINKFRANPRELARHLQQLKKYLDKIKQKGVVYHIKNLNKFN